jgi:hypothetical protein
MSIPTGRELKLLAGLRTDWNRLYWNELAQLLTGNARSNDAGGDAIAPDVPINRKPARRRRVPPQPS